MKTIWIVTLGILKLGVLIALGVWAFRVLMGVGA